MEQVFVLYNKEGVNFQIGEVVHLSIYRKLKKKQKKINNICIYIEIVYFFVFFSILINNCLKVSPYLSLVTNFVFQFLTGCLD